MADLSTLAGLTFSADDSALQAGQLTLDFSDLASGGSVTITGQAPIVSNADIAAAEDQPAISEQILTVDTSASTPFGLGTVTFVEIQNGTTGPTQTADIIGINGTQVLLGIGTYDATNPGDPFDGNYLLLSDTSLSQASNPTPGATVTFTLSDTNANAYSPPCFAAGTRIATPDGDVAVERLRAGDLVLTLSGETRRVIWAGSRRVDIARHPRPDTVRPVRIEAGAFAEQVPSRDLLLSPDHSIHTNGVLIPAKCLINSSTVVQLDRPSITYHHIELDSHDVVLAEKLPCETYLETGNRTSFNTRADTVFVPHPDFTVFTETVFFTWESQGFAPLVLVGPELDAAREHLARRGAARHPHDRASRSAA